ncbi:MAG: altronate dehydratase family protein [Succiniclasticum sp.]|nr:altronate dehydratase family protein [Succiniclasticum sp.]MDY6346134.1 altronate dehydratase family protein [Succiniclasticum sp.]
MENGYIQIHEADNVAVALRDWQAGESVSLLPGSLALRDAVPRGHKFALQDIAAGTDVVKYGVPIGHATRDIAAGEHVHIHNMQTNLSGEEEYTYHYRECALPPVEGGTFRGFLRKDGQAGIRNEVWILPAVGCVNDIAARLAADNQDLLEGTSVSGLYAFPHPYGCSQSGADHAQTRNLLAALAHHPNAGAVLILHLGCENLTREQFVEALGEYDPERIRFVTCQDVEDEAAAGRQALRECVAYAARFMRQDVPVSKLVVGLKCGGSDGLSGITANPTVGRFSDLLLARGGSTILTEVPEMFGAESMLLDRCVDVDVFQRAAAMLNGFKEYFLSHHTVVYENPSPGNKAGGISTLEDKSCGCVQKGGTAPVADILEYGGRVRKPGLSLLYGPGNDLISSTALTAAGAQMLLFTTGRGTPFGTPVPTLKVASNTDLAVRKARWIDFNAGTVAEGESLGDAAARLFELVLATAEGQPAQNERNGCRGIAIFKDGVSL